MQFTAARDAEFIGIIELLNTQRHVRNQLFVEAVLKVPRGHKFTFAARKWRVIDLEGHRDCRLINGQCWEHFNMLGIANHVRNTELVDTCETANIARRDAFHLHAVEAHKSIKINDTAFTLCSIRRRDDNIFFRIQCPAHNAANPDDACISAVIQS